MTKKLFKISKYKPSIFQGTFEFSAGSDSVSISLEHPRERLILRILCAALIALFCVYLYFVTASVLNVIARREAQTQIASIEGAIGQAEQKYFALSHGVTPQEGESLGLSPVSGTDYVYRPGNLGAATIAPNGI